MFRKSVMMATLAASVLVWTSAAYASHRGIREWHIIGGKAYFYSLNFEGLIKYLTGKDIKEGSIMSGNVKILSSESACSNPNSHVINPGEGPKGGAYLQSEPITDANIAKTDRQKRNEFQVLASGEIVVNSDRLRNDLGLCKQSNGTQWNQIYWQDGNCNKESVNNTCYGHDYNPPTNYPRLAAWINDQLTIVPSNVPVINCTRALKNIPPPAGSDPYEYTGVDCQYWTFVFLPGTFVIDAFVVTAEITQEDSHSYFRCTFKPNNETGAAMPGAPYSFSNPPVNGWGGPTPAGYDCVSIDKGEYDIPIP